MTRPRPGPAKPTKLDAYWSGGALPPIQYVTLVIDGGDLIIRTPFIPPVLLVLSPLLFPPVAIYLHLLGGVFMILAMVLIVTVGPQRVAARARVDEVTACTVSPRSGRFKLLQREVVHLAFAHGGAWRLTSTERHDARAIRLVAALTAAGIVCRPA